MYQFKWLIMYKYLWDGKITYVLHVQMHRTVRVDSSQSEPCRYTWCSCKSTDTTAWQMRRVHVQCWALTSYKKL